MRYKKIFFDNTYDNWVKHSINMPFVLRCKTFVEEEMSRRNDVKGIYFYNEDKKDGGTENGSKKKKKIELDIVKDVEFITDTLSNTEMCVETNNHVMTDKILWNVLLSLKKMFLVMQRKMRIRTQETSVFLVLGCTRLEYYQIYLIVMTIKMKRKN